MSLTPEQQNRVLNSAVDLFARHDLNSITIDQITQMSGISAFDMVRHYRSKENLLSAVLERELELMSAAAHAPELRMPGETLRDELQGLARIILAEYRHRLPLLSKLLMESMRDPQVGVLFYKTFIVQGRLLFSEFLNTRMELGEVRPELDVEAAAAMFLSFLTSVVLLGEMCGGKNVETFDDQRVITQMSDVLLRGIQNKKP
jgi:AcrR family transcriptional regulator